MLTAIRIACVLAAAGVLTCTSPALASTVAPEGPPPPSVTLAGSAPSSTTATATDGTLSPSTPLTFEVWLAPDIAGATAFADSVSTPGSAVYHHYLTPDQYTARVRAHEPPRPTPSPRGWSAGASPKSRSALRRDSVTATGSAAQVDTAFSVQMGDDGTATSRGVRRQRPRPLGAVLAQRRRPVGDRPGRRAARDLPHHAAGDHRQPRNARSTGASRRPTASRRSQSVHRAAVAVCGYSADQLRAAYGADGRRHGRRADHCADRGRHAERHVPDAHRLRGGQWPARAEAGAVSRRPARGIPGCENAFGVEEQLDSEATYAMAPGADQLMVDGDSCNEKLQGDPAALRRARQSARRQRLDPAGVDRLQLLGADGRRGGSAGLRPDRSRDRSARGRRGRRHVLRVR